MNENENMGVPSALRTPWEAAFLSVVFFSFIFHQSSLASPLSAPPLFSRLDSLFLIASTGEPRFAAQRDSSEKILVAEGAATLEYLVRSTHENPPRDRTPRQRHYVERLFTLIADSGRSSAPRDALARAIAEAPNDTLRARWLYIGSRMGDTAFGEVAPPWLDSGSALARRMAARVLGAYPRPADVPRLLDGVEASLGADRHAFLWALGEHPPLGDWERLVPFLSDEDYSNRRKVRDILLKATDSSWTKLRAAMPEDPDPELRREWRLLALEAKGGREFLKEETKRMTGEEKRFFGIAPAGDP